MKTAQRLSAAVAGLMLTQSVLGILLPSRYRDVEWIKASWIGNDWVTLVIALPLLLAGLAYAKQGSARGLLLWLGMLGYAVYNYAYYLLGAALNAFFPLYLFGLVIALLALILAVSRVDVANVAHRFRTGTPVRVVGGYLAFLGIGLASVWLGTWAAYVFAGRRTPIEPEAFKLVAALDSSIMVPVLVLGGVLLWRHDPWGYLVAAIAGVQGSLYLLVLAVNSSIAIVRGLAEAPGELPIWGTLAVLTSTLTLVLLTNLRAEV